SIRSLSYPLFHFVHIIWRRSLLFAPEKDRHHISKEELLLLCAIHESYPLHPGWVLARLFHLKTKSTKAPLSLFGGNFVGRLIINLGLSHSWGLEVPRHVMRTVGGDLAVEYDLQLDYSPQEAAVPPLYQGVESEEEDDFEEQQTQPEQDFHHQMPPQQPPARYAHQQHPLHQAPCRCLIHIPDRL
ncbi:hypothetical protein LINPERHAP2_LOCUS40366, partial [Linum perenne]